MVTMVTVAEKVPGSLRLEPSGMNVSSTVSLLFKSKVMKLGSENGVFSGSEALLISVIRPNVPLYCANVPVELATTNPP
jgi:hypothetical protein